MLTDMTSDDPTTPAAEATVPRPDTRADDRLERLVAENAVRGDRLMTLSLENAELRRRVDQGYVELAEAARMLAATRRRMIKAEEALTLERKLRKQAEAYADQITSSSVWRLTGPLRRIVGRMLGRG